MKLYRRICICVVLSLVSTAAACSDDGDGGGQAAADAGSDAAPTCSSQQWYDYSAGQCQQCPPAEQTCFMFDYFAAHDDYDSVFDPETDVLRWDVNPGDIEIVSATLSGDVLTASGGGDGFSVPATVDGNTMRFDLSEIAGPDEKLRVQHFEATDGCGLDLDIPQAFRLDPNADDPQKIFGCNPAPMPPQ